jgi:hypothetical protein
MQPKDFSKENPKLQWQAEEFFYTEKSFFWYLALIFGGAIISLVPWLISGRKDLLSPLIIFISALSLIAYSARKPRIKSYSLTNSSLHINNQNFSLLDFSYYWVDNFQDHTQITLVGTKRTSMPITFYLKDATLTNKIITILQSKLPQTNPSKNPIDILARKLKL